VGEVTSKMEEGQTVEFDVTEGEKGPQAANVRLVGQ
jgi:cold shock CspA family protein